MNISAKYRGAMLDSLNISAATYSDVQERIWEDRHLHWARAVGRAYDGNEEVLTRHIRRGRVDVTVRQGVGQPDKLAGEVEDVPFAPLWLHALWDVMTEEVWEERSRKRPVTSKTLDRWLVRKVVRDEAFRLALAVVYGEGGIPAAVDFIVPLALAEGFQDEPGYEARRLKKRPG